MAVSTIIPGMRKLAHVEANMGPQAHQMVLIER